MADPLAGRVALLTGANTGIGLAVAGQLVARGVRVVITGRHRERGQLARTALAAHGAEVRFVAVDVSSEAGTSETVEAVVRDFGTVDYLLNNAAYEGPLAPLVDLSEEDCDLLLATNVKGPIMAVKHVIPHMLRTGGGCIVNVASFLGTIPFPMGVGYGATKAALIHFTRSVAAGYGADGIRCYAACPYITSTAMIERVTGGNEAIKQQLASLNPSGRIAAPADIAGVIVDLFAGRRSAPNGSALLIDAGGVVSTPT